MSFRGAAPSSGKTQIPPRSLGPNGPLISNLVPSWNQLTVVHRKQQFSGGGKLRVSPVSILRMWSPVRSTYARDAPSGEIEARGTGSSGGLFVTCRTFSSGIADGSPNHPSLKPVSVIPNDNSSAAATAASHRLRQDAGIRRRSKSARSSLAVWYRTVRSFSRALLWPGGKDGELPGGGIDERFPVEAGPVQHLHLPRNEYHGLRFRQQRQRRHRGPLAGYRGNHPRIPVAERKVRLLRIPRGKRDHD